MESLFAAADDFSEMLEETGKSSKHGTLGEIFNKDKSSQKQIDWEEKRMQKRGGKKRFQPRLKAKKGQRISQGKRNRGEISERAKLSIQKHKK